MRLLLWGISNRLQDFILDRGYLLDEKNVVGYIDRDEKWRKKQFRGKPVFNPDQIEDNLGIFDYVMITSSLYKDEIYDDALKIEGLKGRIIPYEYLYPRFDGEYSKAFERQYKEGSIHIIKGWYVSSGERNIIISISNEVGKKLLIGVIPEGVGIGNKKTRCQIKNVQNDFILFNDLIDGNSRLSIPIECNNLILRISISCLSRVFLSTIVEATNNYEGIEDTITRTAFCNEVSKIYDQEYHEFDYSFLDIVSSIENRIILDIGANIGQSSMTFLKHTRCSVVAIEPYPRYSSALKILSSEYGDRFEYITCGAGEHEEELIFYIPKFEREKTQEASFHKDKVKERIRSCLNIDVTEENEGDYIETQSIPVVPIDIIAKNFAAPILFAKIDSETYELEVIKGMTQVIKRDKPIIMLEYNSPEIVNSIFLEVNKIENYSTMHWNYTDKEFVSENVKSSINYFLIPNNNSAVYVDGEGHIAIRREKEC